jgi:hypothetical protein
MFDVQPITSPKQLDCGPTCLQMLLAYYGVEVDLDTLIKECNVTVAGCTGADLLRAGRLHGLDMQCWSMDADELVRQDRPAIVNWRCNHWCVFCGRDEDGRVSVCNPDRGRYRMSEGTFASLFSGLADHPGQGVAITNGEPKWLGVSGNIPAGTYFEADGRWYRALRAIARGEEVAEGINAQAADLAEIINTISDKEEDSEE